MTKASRFWIVCCPGRMETHPPRFMHGSFEAAKAEAIRLAKEHAPASFHVMASATAYCRVDISEVIFREEVTEADTVPF